MLQKKRCAICKTGKAMLDLDPSSPMCPYLYCHNGKKCGMFARIPKNRWTALCKRFRRWLQHK